MAARQQKRLQKELNDLSNSPIEGVTIDLLQDSVTNWAVHIQGPSGTGYEGGKFTISIDFSDNYPFKCPKVQFVTKIYHPNIKTDTGEICAQALQNNWVPTLNANYIIRAMIELMTSPSSENPMETEVARLMQSNSSKYMETVKEFTEKYAK